MEILTKENLRLRYDEVLEKIKDGVIFIYPTDTIYGIGCNALNKKAIEKIRTIKESLAIKRAKEYVNRQIVNCRRTLPLHKTPRTNLLRRIVEDIDKFNGRFPEEYL